jgi:hypothetical protein
LVVVSGSFAALGQQERPRFPTASAQSARGATPGYTRVEAESLVAGAIASAGRASAQPMASFGASWSGNAQLFWQPAELDERDPATLRVMFDAPSAGDYSIRLGYTRAPDYANLQLYVDGDLERELNGYAETVQRANVVLADRHLEAGPNELVLRVLGKNPRSRGYFAGLDSIELLLIKSGSNRGLQTYTARGQRTGGAGQGAQSTVQQPTNPILGFSATLAFSTPDAKLNQGALGAVEGDVFESNPKMLLAFETTAKDLQWRWQVATQPFSTESALTGVPGVIALGPAAQSPFTIDLSHVAPFGEPPTPLKSAQGGAAAPPAAQAKPGPMTLYVRLVPVKGGAVAGPPSNSVTAHYKTGASAPEKAATAAAQTAALGQQMLGYTVAIESFDPAKFPNRIGCIVVVKNPYTVAPAHALAKYKVGSEYCPKYKHEDKDALYWVGQAFKGWFIAAELGADYYNGAKGWIVDQIVSVIPCDQLGDDLASSCEGAFHVIVDSALTSAMASAGIPPTMPSLTQLEAAAEGKLVDAAVEFTCDQLEGDSKSGGGCDALVEQKLRELYAGGLAELKKQAKRAGQEPDCGTVPDPNWEPLPCFTDFAGTEVKPAPGAIYVPPFVTLAVTRTKPVPSPYLACRATLTMHAKNHFEGTSYVNGVKLAAKDIAGELYAPAVVAIPLLEQGESVKLKIAFQQFRLFSIASNASTPSGTLAEWAELYWGGDGTIGAGTDGPLPVSMSSGRAPCSGPASLAVKLPNGA